MNRTKEFDVIIIGGGVTGTALLYTLSKYTNIPRIALIEKHDQAGNVNSHHNNNSQTLHFGDIETNYTVEKAARVKEAATMVKRYVQKHRGHLYNKTHKMVLGVGAKQCRALEKRYEEFKKLFPKLEVIRRKEIGRLEPKILEGRDPDEEIIALKTDDGYAVNFRLLSESFLHQALIEKETSEIFMGTSVKNIKKDGDEYQVCTSKGEYRAPVVLVCAGSHSLIFAQKMGIGTTLGLLPVAGSFFGTTKRMLNGKVYTVQIEKLPFAAIHGDPAVTNPHETRFGPTAKVLPMLERRNYSTIPDFIKTSVWNVSGILSLLKIASDWTLIRYILRNLTYDIPFIGKRLFIKEVRKIVPNIKVSELKYKALYGGIRPQIIDTTTKKLNMGEAKLEGDNLIFNITPSPGASVCLKNAHTDTCKVMSFFKGKFKFFEDEFLDAYTERGELLDSDESYHTLSQRNSWHIKENQEGLSIGPE